MIEYESLLSSNTMFMDELKSAACDVLESGWYILGQKVDEFEQNFAKYIEDKKSDSHLDCVGVANGLEALSISLKALKFPAGSEVLVPSNTYIASILAILEAGLIPILVEPDLQTYNIDPVLIPQHLTPKTRAIMVVHLYGKSCDMDPILTICRDHKLSLVEDCAQSHGARYKGTMTGNFGGFGCFSFYPTKNLGGFGDGGAIVLDQSSTYADHVRMMRNYGSIIKYENEIVGGNSRLDEIQAALLSVKLKYLDKITEHKRKLAQIYHDHLSDQFIKPVIHSDFYDVYHIYNIRHKERNRLQAYLLENGVKTAIHYPIAPHHQKAMKGILAGSYPISEEIHSTTLSLPISYGHTEEEVSKVVDIMNQF